MAQRFQSNQELISCSTCLDLLNDPVTFFCGHNYCRKCVGTKWDAENEKRVYSCPKCTQTFTQSPVLGKNTMLADLVEELIKTGLQAAPAAHCYAGPGDVACDVCTGRKLRAGMSCLQCLASFCHKHIQPHLESAAFMKHNLVKPLKGLLRNVCSRNGEVMKTLCRTDQQSIVSFCSVDQYRGHNTVSVEAELIGRQGGLEGTRLNIFPSTAVNIWRSIPQTVTEVNLSLSQPENMTRAEFLKYSRDITLDPNTANIMLLLSDGNRKATLMDQPQTNSSHPDRFTGWWQVLSTESLTGRCYWEVEWKGGVCVAVAYKNISRAGKSNECMFGRNDKSFSLDCHESYDFVFNNVKTRILGPLSSRVGVYLDHRAGILSFYSVSETMTLLHRVQTTFTQPLHVGLSVYCQSSTAELCGVY